MLSQSLSHALQTTGGASDSIFYELEFRINENKKSLSAIKYFVGRIKTRNRYYSLIDFLVCEFFPKYDGFCKKFYKNHKIPLRESISPEEKASIEMSLLLVVDLLEVYFEEKSKITWTEIKIISPKVFYSLEEF